MQQQCSTQLSTKVHTFLASHRYENTFMGKFFNYNTITYVVFMLLNKEAFKCFLNLRQERLQYYGLLMKGFDSICMDVIWNSV